MNYIPDRQGRKPPGNGCNEMIVTSGSPTPAQPGKSRRKHLTAIVILLQLIPSATADRFAPCATSASALAFLAVIRVSRSLGKISAGASER